MSRSLWSLVLFLVLITTSIVRSQYDGEPAGTTNTPPIFPRVGPVVRVDGEVHAEKAEENHLAGGLGATDENKSRTSSENTTPQSSTSSSTVIAKASEQSASTNEVTSGSTALPSAQTEGSTTSEQSASTKEVTATSQASPSAQTDVSNASPSGQIEGSTVALTSETDAPSDATKQSASTNEVSGTSPSVQIEVSTNAPTSETGNSSTGSSNDTSSPTQVTKLVPSSTKKSLESSESDEVTNGDSSSVELTTASETPVPISTSTSKSYESNEKVESPTAPPSPTSHADDSTTYPPSIEPLAPGTTPRISYTTDVYADLTSETPAETTGFSRVSQVTLDISASNDAQPQKFSSRGKQQKNEETVTQSSVSLISAKTTPNEGSQSSASESQEVSTSAEEETTLSNIQSTTTSSTYKSAESSESTASLSTTQTSQPTRAKNSPTQSGSSSSKTKTAASSAKPLTSSRAWKIKQGNGKMSVDGSTSDQNAKVVEAESADRLGTASSVSGSLNSSAKQTSGKTNVTMAVLQPSGYGQNEISSPSEKASRVVSPQEAVGYEVPDPANGAQRDPIVNSIDFRGSSPLKQVHSSTRRKWKPWRMDCDAETDDRGEELCREWARGGLCDAHRATMFLFCRKTCLCVGPPDETAGELRRRNRRFHSPRL